jgi:hypothetical protein
MSTSLQIHQVKKSNDPLALAALAAAEEAARLARRQRDCANRDQVSLNASAKTYFAAVAADTVITY